MPLLITSLVLCATLLTCLFRLYDDHQFGHQDYFVRRSLKDEASTCKLLQDQYGVVPGVSWGEIPPEEKNKWVELNCDSHAVRPTVEKGTSSENLEKCKSIAKQNRLSGSSPGKNFKKMPTHMKVFWKELMCERLLAGGGRGPAEAGGALRGATCSAEEQAEAETIALVFAVTTRGVKVGAGDRFVKELAAFDILLPSFALTAECGFRYVVAMAYDRGDPFYDSAPGREKVHNWFNANIQEPFEKANVDVELILAETDNQVKKPGPAFTAGTKAAFEAGADWFYRVNDDTEFLDPWARKFTLGLESLGPPYGVVGPKCHRCNSRILVHDFTHRTHMEIFAGHYYPPQLSDWWMDDWISRVYGSKRTFMASACKAMHHTGKHGQRYQVDHSHQKFLQGLINEGHKRIASYAEEKGLLTDTELKGFRDDRTNGQPYKDLPKL